MGKKTWRHFRLLKEVTCSLSRISSRHRLKLAYSMLFHRYWMRIIQYLNEVGSWNVLAKQIMLTINITKLEFRMFKKGCSLRLWLLQNKIACREWNIMEKPQAVLVCSVNIGKFIIQGTVIKTSKCRLKSHLFILRKNCFTLLPGALGDVIAAICAAATSLTSHTGSDNLGTIGICRSRSRRWNCKR